MAELLSLDVQVSIAGQQTDDIALSGLGLTKLDVTCSPEQIVSGITCGMSDMCGEDPCLCGAADEFGCCACNGTETLGADVSVTSSNALTACPLHLGKSWYLLGVAPGEADVTVSAGLLHYEDAALVQHVHASAPGGLVCAGIVVAIAVAAAVVATVLRRKKRAARTQESNGE